MKTAEENLANLLALRTSIYNVSNIADKLKSSQNNLQELESTPESTSDKWLLLQRENLFVGKITDEEAVDLYLYDLEEENKKKVYKTRKILFWLVIVLTATVIITVSLLAGLGFVPCLIPAVREYGNSIEMSEIFSLLVFEVPLVGAITFVVLAIIRAAIIGLLKMSCKSQEANQRDEDRQRIISQNRSKNKEIDDKINAIDREINNHKANRRKEIANLQVKINVLGKVAGANLTFLENEYGSFLHISDWGNLDYLIYLFVTRRADNMKEALHLLDEQKRTEMIVEAIKSSSQYLAQNISVTINQLGNMLQSEFSNINQSLSQINSSIIASAKQAHADSVAIKQSVLTTQMTTQMLMSSFAIQSNAMMSNISGILSRNTKY